MHYKIYVFQLKDIETRYNTIKRKVLAVIQYLADIIWLVIRSKYPIKLYIIYSILENIFT